MKVQIIGARRMDFATEKGQVTGIKLYITGKNPNVIGHIADSVWITPESTVYPVACSLDLSKGPVNAELVYEQFVGVKKPVLTELKVG